MMKKEASIKFTKMHGAGNDFIVINDLSDPFTSIATPELIKQLCVRRFGIGSDGVILVKEGSIHPLKMVMYNPDGTLGNACGNGLRCFAKFARAHRLVSADQFEVETAKGVSQVEVLSHSLVRANMGRASFVPTAGMQHPVSAKAYSEIDVSIEGHSFKAVGVSIGNSHLVVYCNNLSEVPLEQWGPLLEHHPLFPERANVHFLQVETPSQLIQRTWEKGAGITLACGSGACACAAAAYWSGRSNSKVDVLLPGGRLEVFCKENGEILMTGPAENVYEGEYKIFGGES